MKITKLIVKELYGYYDYDVNFNSDVTFIYGLNGCGKTTILNITEAIITGQIYKLFEYKFKKIILEYSPKTAPENIQKISIASDGECLIIVFKNKEHILETINENREKMMDFEKTKYYFKKYTFLSEIKNVFNYVYLPLNRSSVVYDFDEENRYFYHRNRTIFIDESFDDSTNKDLAMNQIEKLIENSYRNINSQISEINDKFRNNILKSLLDVNEQYTSSNDLFKEIIQEQANVSSIKQTKVAYIKILKDLSLINKDEEINFSEFFDSVCNDINKNRDRISATTLLKMNEVIKIKKIVSLAEETEKQKTTIRKPIEKFIQTMNDFITNDEEEKKIEINQMGHIYFTTKYNKTPISIQYLSSGEKQLLTFFANLIFKVDSKRSGIFVVDEPELSLHLSWQKIFVDKVLEIDKNIQLIFATHAPEIIGRRRNKMYRLDKKYVGDII